METKSMTEKFPKNTVLNHVVEILIMFLTGFENYQKIGSISRQYTDTVYLCLRL